MKTLTLDGFTEKDLTLLQNKVKQKDGSFLVWDHWLNDTTLGVSGPKVLVVKNKNRKSVYAIGGYQYGSSVEKAALRLINSIEKDNYVNAEIKLLEDKPFVIGGFSDSGWHTTDVTIPIPEGLYYDRLDFFGHIQSKTKVVINLALRQKNGPEMPIETKIEYGNRITNAVKTAIVDKIKTFKGRIESSWMDFKFTKVGDMSVVGFTYHQLIFGTQKRFINFPINHYQ